MTITLPHQFEPRIYQLPFLAAMDSGKLRAVKVWHRKAGKEKTDWNFLIKKSQERVGNYWYVFPLLTQARKVIWEGIDQHGFKFLDHIPKEMMVGKPNKTTMMIHLRNGSTIQLIGSDSFDSSIGANPVGIVFSEYSLTDPYVWGFARPILAVNGGWAIFNFTPRGENHAYDLYCLAKADPQHWFCELLTVDDTQAIPQDVLDQELREIVRLYGDDAFFQQEYHCSFSVPLAGAYYMHQITQAQRDGRVTHVPYDPRYLVDTYWDLGKGDKMPVWFAQQIGPNIHLIDYKRGIGVGIVDYIPELRKLPYQYGKHWAPHDIDTTETFSGKTRKASAAQLGFIFNTAPKLPVDDGIDAVRGVFHRLWIDKEHCAEGLNGLKNYCKEYDEDKKMFLNIPLHNWASHPADALRTLAVALDTDAQSLPHEDRYARPTPGFLRPRTRQTEPLVI